MHPDDNDQHFSAPSLDRGQRRQLLIEWNLTATDYPKDTCVHELFAQQASQTPNDVAVAFGDKCLTYEELDRFANQVAHYLQSLEVGPEVVVGLCVSRSLEMIIGLLGILKAGGAYLPLDPSYPEERLAYMLSDAGARLVLTQSGVAPGLARCGARLIRLDEDWPMIAEQPIQTPVSGATPDNLVYVMYTSGSVGKPKGVGIVHYNVNRLVRNTNYIQITPKDVFLQLAPLAFDAATLEIWGALLNGAKLVLYPPDRMVDPLRLKRLIESAGVSILWLTAGLFHRIVDEDMSILAPIKQLLAGGDVVSAPHVKRLLERTNGCQVINGYGPTEGTTFSVCFRVPDLSSIETTVPIGRPISNTQIYVLDSELQLVPVRAPGELHIAGAGLGRGYFNRPDLTAESFIPNPFGPPGSRLYRTGDMVRYSDNGTVEFLGRIDLQVKVRGYRIELQEIEATLLSDPSVGQAVVLASEDASLDKRLVAYVVGQNGAAPDLEKLRAYLTRNLPDYMIPSAFVVMKQLPLTPNGKVDRSALPAPEWQPTRTSAATPIEKTVSEIWKQILGINEVGLQDDFFDLGGTSLGLISVVMKMSERFSLPLDTGIVTQGATVAALANAVRERLKTAESAAAVAPSAATPIEKTVSEIWKQILGINEVGLQDDFFDLGGTSLGLISVVMKMSERFSLPLDTGIVTQGATVAALANAVREKVSITQLLEVA
jgi:aspartate racemase